MDSSSLQGMYFGLTEGTVTTMGIIIGMMASLPMKKAIFSAVIAATLSDSFGDSIGIYYSEEATPYALPREIPVIDIDLLYLDDYLAKNPAIIKADNEVRAARHSLDAVTKSEMGVLSIEGSFGYTKNPGSNNFLNDRKIGLTFSRQLYSGGASEARVDQAKASLEQAKLSSQKVRIEVSREIRDAFANYQGNVAAVDSRMLVFNGAKDSYSITKELYSFSRISLFEVLSAQEQLFNSGRQLIDSIVDRAISKYQLLRITYELQEQLDYFGN